MKEVNLFEGPIPGQSLTDTPRNGPWESPPEINDLESAVKYYIQRVSKPEVLDDLALVFELGGTIDDVTEVLTTMGTMKGIHSVDIQMLAAPMLGAYIKAAMTYYDIDAPEDLEAITDISTEREKLRMQKVFNDAIAKSKRQGADEGTELLEEMSDTAEEMPQEEQEAPMEEPMAPSQGLMSKEMM